MATKPSSSRALASCFAVGALVALFSCNDSNSSTPSSVGAPPGPNPPQVLGRFDTLPGLKVVITEVSGGSSPAGSFRPGDLPVVRFTVKTNAGVNLNPATLGSGSIYVSGPTSNHQRVIAEQKDLRAAAVWEGGGVWRYTFTKPIPTTYLPPLNDTAAFGAGDGELQGQGLKSGTYTVGIEFQQIYFNEDDEFVDAGAAVKDFALGDGVTVVARQVVQNANCNLCHTELRAHGGARKDTSLCVLCHTAGAEDSNVNGATPGVSIDFRVMIHKLHDGLHLPSVRGVSVAADGSRVYPGTAGAVAPRALRYADDEGTFADFSEVNFPVFPSFNIAMPKDLGYSALSSVDPDGSGPLLSAKGCEDQIRRGVTSCAKCHGDPDGSGPLAAPAQGDNHRTNPSRAACMSCHDDLEFGKPYTANGQTMVAGLGDDTCVQCHTDVAANQKTANYKQLSVTEAHWHPLNNPAVDSGVNCVVTAVAGGTAANGNFQAGDRPVAKFTLKDDAGQTLGIAAMDSASATFLGPTTNRQLILPAPSASGVAFSPFDFTGRLQAVSTTNKGTMSKVFLGSNAVAETLTVEFTSSTAFSVTGTQSGALGTGTLPGSLSTNPTGASITNFEIGSSLTTGTIQVVFSDATNFAVTGAATGTGSLPASTSASTRFVSPNFSFNIAVGTAAFAAGNTFQIGLFRGAPANPVGFVIVAGKSAFSATAGARDRFYFEVVPNAVSYEVNIPMDLVTEFLADSTATAGQQLPAPGNLPVYFGRQVLYEATNATPTTTSAEAVAILGRQMAINPVTGFANNDYVVIEPTNGVGVREYVQVQPTKPDGTTATATDTTVRLYFRTPLRYAHASGVTVNKVTLAFKQEGASNVYTLNASTGVITSNGPFTASTALVLSYRSQARFGFKRHNGDALQTYYTTPPNDTAFVGQEQGEWSGLPYQDGTYTVDLWLYKNIDLKLNNEVQTYRSTSLGATKDFLFGSASAIVPHAIIASGATCNQCHDDLSFHGGGRRGTEACLSCHSISGGMSALVVTPTTQSVPIEFRQMVHKIHMGADLKNGATYPFATAGEFPATPGGVKQCVRCHGNEAWKEPAPRLNAFATFPTRNYGVVCGSCHDSLPAQAHIASNTSIGLSDSCSVCHGPGKEWAVQKVHVNR